MQEIATDAVQSWPVDLDITKETCPMTFVRVRLLLDRLAPGTEMCVRLAGQEPLHNVPRTLRQQGHSVLALAPEGPDDGPWRLRVRKKSQG